jgi:hypothetical protein
VSRIEDTQAIGRTTLKVLRTVAGFALVLSATGVLVQGGLSRYAKYGMPPHADWRIIAFGLVLLSAGTFLIRPDFFLRRNPK